MQRSETRSASKHQGRFSPKGKSVLTTLFSDEKCCSLPDGRGSASGTHPEPLRGSRRLAAITKGSAFLLASGKKNERGFLWRI